MPDEDTLTLAERNDVLSEVLTLLADRAPAAFDSVHVLGAAIAELCLMAKDPSGAVRYITNAIVITVDESVRAQGPTGPDTKGVSL